MFQRVPAPFISLLNVPRPLVIFCVGIRSASEKNFDAVRQGMFQVVNAPGGSGRQGKLQNYTLFGKTGTAEIGSRKNRRQNTWFIAFVRHMDKTYAAALIIQDGKSGGSTCAPVMAEFFERYLEHK